MKNMLLLYFRTQMKMFSLCKDSRVTSELANIAQGILTYRRYTQSEFQLKFSALLKAYDAKYTENSKK